ncbi:HGGxSTG domain-containing protein [Legionella fairfieldensis]|uniref:HGGxSTG domain-containing protein n=1 Tax=Legionella fairfieldensis TaxID=45064 RepID=UPI000563DEB8|nr:HGGxSTG domain-containing protein [Legionella fairfieldensis]
MKTTSCNGQKQYTFNNAPRCGAKTKHHNGKPCLAPAVRGKRRCRIHGGSKGSGGQQGNSNALKHGYTTKAIKNFRENVKIAIQEATRLTDANFFD